MMAFTAALDALVTTNLVHDSEIFTYQTIATAGKSVTSDLGIKLPVDSCLATDDELARADFDIVIVCGGYRTPLAEDARLTSFLQSADKSGAVLAALWNGVIPIAHAGLMQDRESALHPDNHAYFGESFKDLRVTKNTMSFDEKRASSSGPASALEMILRLIQSVIGAEAVKDVCQIINCDSVKQSSTDTPLQIGDDPRLPEPVREAMQLMRSNIEEPLTLGEISDCINISRRQLERLFHNHLDISPSRHYLHIRLNHARNLLQQTNETITNVALASGFVSSSHFSNCFKEHFGMSPTTIRSKRRGLSPQSSEREVSWADGSVKPNRPGSPLTFRLAVDQTAAFRQVSGL
ncbi:GlxA family transcriptional regulator [Neptuniibacter halophilus]|uniref:GlxA family transcriptional regulator n=1 Tax=Neptuniibacter halophilus TaxID=651666 RepID=UPI00257286C1|nr:helix-turn-helix domain-containing protein [Neptuniibacter halophilus]